MRSTAHAPFCTDIVVVVRWCNRVVASCYGASAIHFNGGAAYIDGGCTFSMVEVWHRSDFFWRTASRTTIYLMEIATLFNVLRAKAGRLGSIPTPRRVA